MLKEFRDYNMSFYFAIGIVGLLFFKKDKIRYITILPILLQWILLALFLVNQYFMVYFWLDIIMSIVLGFMLFAYKFEFGKIRR